MRDLTTCPSRPRNRADRPSPAKCGGLIGENSSPVAAGRSGLSRAPGLRCERRDGEAHSIRRQMDRRAQGMEPGLPNGVWASPATGQVESTAHGGLRNCMIQVPCITRRSFNPRVHRLFGSWPVPSRDLLRTPSGTRRSAPRDASSPADVMRRGVRVEDGGGREPSPSHPQASVPR
jgi:hypothetical protein